jgi:hypothetical protein
LEWAERLPDKSNKYVTAREFTENLPKMLPTAESQLVSKLNVADIKLSKTAWNALGDLQEEVAKRLGALVGERQWLIRSEEGVVVAVLGSDYTIIDNRVVAEAVSKCDLPCYDIWPAKPDMYTRIVYFKLVSKEHQYYLHSEDDYRPVWLAVNLRNSEVGSSAIAADIGFCRGDLLTGNLSYMWSRRRIEVSACIRHCHNDPEQVVGVIEEILKEAPGIAQMHVDYIRLAANRKWDGWDDNDDRFPEYVMEHVDLTNPKSVADVYFAICDSLRQVENAMQRRKLEMRAMSVVEGGYSGAPDAIIVGTCPLCGKEQDD